MFSKKPPPLPPKPQPPQPQSLVSIITTPDDSGKKEEEGKKKEKEKKAPPPPPPPSSPPPTEPSSSSPTPEGKKFSLSEKILNEIVRLVLPFLSDIILKKKIKPIEQEVSSMFGKIKFTLNDLVISSLEIDPKDVITELEHSEEHKATVVVITVTKFLAKLENFSWTYEKLSFPKISDSGLATAVISSGKIGIKVIPDVGIIRKTKFTVLDLSFIIGDLTISTDQAKASKFYNWVCDHFSDTLKGIIQKKLTKTLKKNIPMINQKLNEPSKSAKEKQEKKERERKEKIEKKERDQKEYDELRAQILERERRDKEEQQARLEEYQASLNQPPPPPRPPKPSSSSSSITVSKRVPPPRPPPPRPPKN